jgi:hypothetical protein
MFGDDSEDDEIQMFNEWFLRNRYDKDFIDRKLKTNYTLQQRYSYDSDDSDDSDVESIISMTIKL